jgi:hypothetical protein
MHMLFKNPYNWLSKQLIHDYSKSFALAQRKAATLGGSHATRPFAETSISVATDASSVAGDGGWKLLGETSKIAQLRGGPIPGVRHQNMRTFSVYKFATHAVKRT